MKDEYKKAAIEWLGKADSDLDFAKASFEELMISIPKCAYYLMTQ